ncbi:MAG: phage major capsid protein [Chitinophagales bacterium]|nr:phage major capsid protein [Chitinophagales bacterium]
MSHTSQTSFEQTTDTVRGLLKDDPANKGIEFGKYKAPQKGSKTSIDLTNAVMRDMPEMVKALDAMRTGNGEERPVDISLSEFVNERYGFATADNSGVSEEFFRSIGLNPSRHTLQYMTQMSDNNEGYRWLVAEVLREPIRLGYRRNPLYPSIIAMEENIAQPSIKMPAIDMSDARVTKIGEAETIPTGTLAFNQKEVKLHKLGVGLKLTDEVIRYTSLNLLSIFMQDMGVQLAMGTDYHAVSVLINGDGNSNGAPVVGVASSGTLTYADILRMWIYMGAAGRMPQSILSNIDMAMTVLGLDQFSRRDYMRYGTSDTAGINLRTPVPQSANYDVHGAMPASNQIMLIDRNSSLIKFNSSALRMDTARIAERQLEGAYATLTTGFGILYRDGRVIIDKSLAYSSYGTPSWMDALALQAAAAYNEQ